jgi:hypothetical protein
LKWQSGRFSPIQCRPPVAEVDHSAPRFLTIHHLWFKPPGIPSNYHSNIEPQPMKSRIHSRISSTAVLIGAMLVAAPSFLIAGSIAIINHGFEDGIMDEDNYIGTTTDWQSGRYDINNFGVWIAGNPNADIYRPTTAEYTDPGVVPEGEKVAYVVGIADFDNGIRQVLTSHLAPNLVYTLSVAIGNPALWNVPPPAPDFRIELLAGGVLLASRTGSPPADDSAFGVATLSYSSGPAPDQIGQPLEIRLITLVDPRDDGYEVDFDDVRLTAEPFALRITRNGMNFDFEWNSQPGKRYDLLTSTDLSTPVADWPPYDDGETVYQNIPATGSTTTLMAVPSVAPSRFFALREETVPPLLMADFEEANGGFSSAKTAGSDWEWGDPDSSGFGGQSVTTGNGGSEKCWGTNIGNPGYYSDPTTDSCLISPVINLTGVAAAKLSFAHAIDIDIAGGDTAVLRIVNADTNALITSIPFPDGDTNSANWQATGPITLPVGTPIRLEWCLTGSGGANDDFMGWYIDDVKVVETTP